MKKRVLAGVALAATLTLVGTACGDTAKTDAEKTSPPKASVTDGASVLRVTLDAGLKEHVYLAALATENALGGRTKGFEAAAAALDENSVALSKAIGSVFGADAEKAFLPLWRSHIGFVVDYTSNFGDKTKQDKAVSDLLGYTQTFGAFLNSAIPALSKDVAADLVKTHILTLKDVIDAQQRKDYEKADSMLRTAADHMGMIASGLADAIVKQLPAKFTGKATSAPAGLLVTLDAGLKEHVYLAALATENALGGRTKGFEAAAAALDENSVALSKAIGSVFGADAEKAFLPLWRSHIGFVVDYTSNFGDKTKQDKAVSDLLGYTQTFGAFLNSAMPAIPKDAAADLVKTHILTLKDVIDAQQRKDYEKADSMLRTAAHHMGMISSALADAIVKQFPAKFA